MDTLILAQDEQSIHNMLQTQPPVYPPGQGPAYSGHTMPGGGFSPNPLGTPEVNVPVDTIPPGGAPPLPGGMGPTTPAKGAGSMKDGIIASIISFATTLLQDEPYRLPRPRDLVQFRIIFIFHQTSAEVARAITDALTSMPMNVNWTTLPDVHGRAVQVTEVWYLSCESGAEVTAKDPRLVDYVGQSAMMRVAAQAGLRTEKKPPPSNPREFFSPPNVFEFSTGDPVTGSVRLNPNRVSFVTTPNWEVTDQGTIQQIPHTPDPENPSAGTIYNWGAPGTAPTTTTVPINGVVNILAQP